MAHLEIFDPPMCCSTGVCGPSVDPLLTAFAADVEWLTSQGVTGYLAEVRERLAHRVEWVSWRPEAPVGAALLLQLSRGLTEATVKPAVP